MRVTRNTFTVTGSISFFLHKREESPRPGKQDLWSAERASRAVPSVAGARNCPGWVPALCLPWCRIAGAPGRDAGRAKCASTASLTSSGTPYNPGELKASSIYTDQPNSLTWCRTGVPSFRKTCRPIHQMVYPEPDTVEDEVSPRSAASPLRTDESCPVTALLSPTKSA